jgi:hypothetical protein
MRLIGRLFVIFFGFLASSIVAGSVVGLTITGPGAWRMLFTEEVVQTVFFSASYVATLAMGITAFALLLLFAVPAELFRLRSIVIYALGGLGVGFVTYYGPYNLGSFFSHGVPPFRGLVLAGFAGLVFGCSYWLIAGRYAGRWRREPPV